MKKIVLVNITPVYISNESCKPVQLTETEKLLNSLFSSQYTFVQVYTKLAEFKAKTYKELDRLIDEFSTKTNNYDFHSIIIK